MIYAPVRIGTLNRYEHFKRCLESLEQNTWAQYTEVYVSVDYPSKESYEDGCNKIKAYLKEKENNHRFLKLNIYIQEENLGPAANYRFLEDMIYQKYDRLISLEDDIEVSPNFLEYMDKALEYGEKDERIYCVCGYRQAKSGILSDLVAGHNMLMRMAYNPWGTGVYRDRKKEMLNTVSVEWMDSIGKNNKYMKKLFKYRKYTFYMYVMEYLINRSKVFFKKDGSLRNIDIVVDIYMILNEKYAIFPVKAKTRNWGFDGTGQNCGEQKNINMKNVQLDDSHHFELAEEDPVLVDKAIMKKMSWGGLPKKSEFYIAVLYYCLYRIKSLF